MCLVVSECVTLRPDCVTLCSACAKTANGILLINAPTMKHLNCTSLSPSTCSYLNYKDTDTLRLLLVSTSISDDPNPNVHHSVQNAVLPGFCGTFLWFLRPKITDFAAAFLQICLFAVKIYHEQHTSYIVITFLTPRTTLGLQNNIWGHQCQ